MALVSKTFSQIITFTRASTATYFNSDGVLTTAAIDSPRFDYDPATLAPRGLLIEQQRTNYLYRSANFSATWSTSPLGSITVTQPGGQTAPDGTQAWKYATNDTASSAHTLFQAWAGGIINTGYCFSVFLKAAEYPRASVWMGNTAFASTTYGALFDLTNGTIITTANGSTARIQNAGNGWYRCSVTATSDGDGGNYVAAINFGPSTYSTVGNTYTPASTGLGGWVWGAQVEIGDFPTSYIPTPGAASVTRNADQASVNTLSPWYNAAAGSLFTESQQIVARTDGALPRIAVIDDGGSSIAINHLWSTSISRLYTAAFIVGFEQWSIGTDGITQTNVNRMASAFQANDFAVSINGAAVSTDTSGSVPAGLTTLRIGAAVSAGSQLNGWIRRITYYPRRLSNAELQAITT